MLRHKASEIAVIQLATADMKKLEGKKLKKFSFSLLKKEISESHSWVKMEKASDARFMSERERGLSV